MIGVKNILIFFIAVLLLPQAYSQLPLEGQLLLKNKKDFSGATVKVEKNGEIVKTIDLNKRGSFSLELEVNNDYLLHFTEEKYVNKKIEIKTQVPEDQDPTKLNPIYFEVELFPDVPDSDLGGFKFPVGKVKYNPEINDFDYDLNYSRSIKNEVDKIEADYEDANENYQVQQKKKELAELKKKQEEERQAELKRQQEELQRQKELAEKRRQEELERQQEEKKRQEELRKQQEEEARKRKAEEEAKERERLLEQQRIKEQREKEAKRIADSIAELREQEKAEKLAKEKKAAKERAEMLEEQKRKEEMERQEKLKQIEKEAEQRRKEEELRKQEEKLKQEKLQKDLQKQAEERREQEVQEKKLTEKEQKELVEKQKEKAKQQFIEEINSNTKKLLDKPGEKIEDIPVSDKEKVVDEYERYGMEITRVIINKGEVVRVYHKVKHYWGGVFYYKNYRIISEHQFEIETGVK